MVTDEILTSAGSSFASQRGEAVSDFMLTDDEKEFRDRAWHFLMPAYPRARFDGVLVELRRLRLVPPGPTAGSFGASSQALLRGVGLGLYDNQQPNAYFNGLMSEPWISSRPPYRRLCNDIAADEVLLNPLDAVADRVEAADRVRERALGGIRGLGRAERDNALGRIAENRGLVWWIGDALGRRIVGYRFALQRLVIEIPERDAVACERALARLEQRAGGAAPVVTAMPRRPNGPAKGYYPWPEDVVPLQK